MSKKKHRKIPGNDTAATSAEKAQKKGATDTNGGGLKSMINWLILLGILIPVLYSDKTMDTNLTIRYICLGTVLFAMTIYFFIIRKLPLQLPSGILLKLVFAFGIAFAAWSVISMFSAINYREGYYEVSRHLMNIILLFFVMSAVSKEEPQILKICKVLVFVSIFQSFVGIFQYYDLAFTELPGANAKPYGLMSNRNLFGSAQALLLPFIIYVFYKGSRLWKTISGIAFVGLVISLLISQTRSAWLAGVAIMLVSLVLVLIFSPGNRKKWLIGFFFSLIAIAAIVFVVLKTDTEGSLSKSVKERTQSLTSPNNKNTESIDNAQERFKIWNKTIKLIKDKPLTGAGAGNWKINILSYGTDGLVWSHGKYAPDRPHNVYLLFASETGIPGALLYFGMWIIIAIIAFKVIYKPKTEDQRILVILMLSGLVAFATDCMFSFPTERMEHTLYIMLLGGIILGTYKANSQSVNLVKAGKPKPFIYLILFILAFNLFIGYTKYNYEIHLNRAKAYENENNFNQMLNETEAGKSNLITMGPETGIVMQLKSSIALKELKQYDKALKEINIAKSYNPNSANIWSTMGTIYTDQKQYNKAIPCYEKALQFTPYYDIILKNLAINYFMVNNYQGCINTLNKVDLKGDSYLTSLFNEATSRLAQKK